MQTYTLLKYPWQTSHDYELAKLPHQFLYLSSTWRAWAKQYRPVPPSVRWVEHWDDERSDAMILHLDQWSYQEPAKRFLFQQFKDLYRGPKIVIIHGSNIVDGCSSVVMKELTAGCSVVCNSQSAMELWDLPNSRHILHGFSPAEWPQTSYEEKNIVLVQPTYGRHPRVTNEAGIAKAEASVSLTWVGRDVHPASFQEYRDFMTRSSVYFNPSPASANPRARAEAMLMGLVVVTTGVNGEDSYIENGVNGFCSNDIDELVEFLCYLEAHPAEVEKIGKRGRATAAKEFSHERFVEEWNQLLDDVIH